MVKLYIFNFKLLLYEYGKLITCLFSLEVWPGFTTSILQYESQVMLCCDVSFKILHTNTVLDSMYQIFDNCQNVDSFHSTCKAQLIGQIVLTRYVIFIVLLSRHSHSPLSLATLTRHSHSPLTRHSHSPLSLATLTHHSLATLTRHSHSPLSLATLTHHSHSPLSLATLTHHSHSPLSLTTLTHHSHSQIGLGVGSCTSNLTNAVQLPVTSITLRDLYS